MQYINTDRYHKQYLLLKLSAAANSESGILQPHVHLIIGHMINYTVDLVIFVCLTFREFPISGLFTKFRIREFTFFFSCAIIIKITITITITITETTLSKSDNFKPYQYIRRIQIKHFLHFTFEFNSFQTEPEISRASYCDGTGRSPR